MIGSELGSDNLGELSQALLPLVVVGLPSKFNTFSPVMDSFYFPRLGHDRNQ